MKKSFQKASFILKIWIFATIIAVSYSCQVVHTANPLPSVDTPNAAFFPESFEGDFLTLDEEPMSFNELGNRYIRINLITEYKSLVEGYIGFTEEELENAPNSEKFRLEGNYLHYHNDSLIQEFTKIKALVEESPNDKELQIQMEILEYMAQNGHMNQTFPVEKRGYLYTYNRNPIMEIDLKKQMVAAYDGTNLVEQGALIVKYYNNRMFLNVQSEIGEWETGIVELTDGILKTNTISFKHALKNKARYEKTANLKQAKKNSIVLDPSLAEIDKMLAEEGFLESLNTLKRIELKGKATNDTPWLLIGIGILILLMLFGFLRRPQTKEQ